MKRSPVTTYILNLAVSDFAILISLNLIALGDILYDNPNFDIFFPWWNIYPVEYILFRFAYSTSQFLLTAISVDSYQPVSDSEFLPGTQMSLLIGSRSHQFSSRKEGGSDLVDRRHWDNQGICLAFHLTSDTIAPLFYAFLVNAVVCLPLITVSTLILFIRFCLKSKQYQRGKLLMAILLTLVFFLICAFPLNVMYLIWFDARSSHEDRFNIDCYNLFDYAFLCASLNSFVNPLLYFLVGRKKRGLCSENLRLILRRVFMEEEEACREEPGTPLSDLQQPPPQEKV
ncbi:hypothetical protein lerEdw1_014460 [Lerista edwardsae]|nr:hypothetical protein lerEdw1_014460 [Lerista edwardsae]